MCFSMLVSSCTVMLLCGVVCGCVLVVAASHRKRKSPSCSSSRSRLKSCLDCLDSGHRIHSGVRRRSCVRSTGEHEAGNADYNNNNSNSIDNNNTTNSNNNNNNDNCSNNNNDNSSSSSNNNDNSSSSNNNNDNSSSSNNNDNSSSNNNNNKNSVRDIRHLHNNNASNAVQNGVDEQAGSKACACGYRVVVDRVCTSPSPANNYACSSTKRPGCFLDYSDARPPSAATVSGDFFGRFEEKKSRQKEQQKGSKTFKNFMKRANTLKETTTFSLSSGWNGPQLRDKKAAEGLLVLREDLYRKLALPKDLCLEVVRILNGALEKMETLFKKHEKMSIVSDMVQDVYQLIYDRCAAVQDTESSASEAVELCEDFLISHTYDVLFGVLSSEEECRDLSVLQRIRSLHWVRAHHLELDVNDIHPTVKEFMDEAMKQLIIIDSKRSPKEKLACVVDAAKNIFRMLQACPVGPSHLGADDLLPAMIYVVLRANPPRLHTNIRLVTLFSAQTRLRSGEGGYMFTNLCGAVHFIENLTASELQMPPEEFESYISGKAVPPEDAATEGVRQMYHNMAALKELNLRQDRLADASEQLKVTLDSLQKDIREQVQRALERTEDATRPHEYRVPRHVPPRCLPAFLRDKVIRTDSPQSPPQPPDLPAPLQPELLHDNTCQSDDNDDSNSNTKSIIKTNNNNDNNNGDISVDNNHVVGDDQKTDLLDGSSVSTTLNMDDVGNVSNTDNNNSNNDSSNNNDNSNDNNKNSSGDSNETKVTSSAIEDDELQVEEDKPEPVTEPAEVAGEVQAGIETSTAAADDSAP